MTRLSRPQPAGGIPTPDAGASGHAARSNALPRPPPPPASEVLPGKPLAAFPADLQSHAAYADAYCGNNDGRVTRPEIDSYEERTAPSNPVFSALAIQLRSALDAPEPTPGLPSLGKIPKGKAALARLLVNHGGSALASDAVEARHKVSKLPLGILQVMAHTGMRVVICVDSVTDHLTELRNVRPRGWPPGSTWDHVPACYMPDRKEVVVAVKDHRIPAHGEGHGSEDALLHEMGHGLDMAHGEISASDQFMDAYNRDLAALQAQPYLAQPPPAGPQEAFAETAAMFLESASGKAELKGRYPALHAFWNAWAAKGFSTPGGVA